MKEICFVTGNRNKLTEVKKLLSNYKVLSLSDINFFKDIPETEKTLHGNAFLKAEVIHKKYNLNCFSDDTGLFIKALDGNPGVKSARFAGENCNSEDNINLVLKKLKDIKNREAYFLTVICLIFENRKYFFEGKVSGQITNEKIGYQGFGYDPIFKPDGYDKTYSEFTIKEKNMFSHRAIAVNKLINFLTNLI